MKPHYLLPVVALVACAAPGDAISAVDVQRHVDYLASDELEGRFARGAGARRAARYIADCFEAAGLEPFGDGGDWFQAVEEGLSPNVVGRIRGSGDGVLVLTAHYDHLAPKERGEDRIYNGADDNASGTAAILELARAFGVDRTPPRRSLIFVAFTGEEMGLVGSRFFVEHPPVDLEEIVGNINLDMISRGDEDLIFCEPGEGSAHLRAAAVKANALDPALEIRFEEHREWLGQSDQHAFLQKGVPAIYFGVEDHPDYHRVSDHADKILPELAARVARLVRRMVNEL